MIQGQMLENSKRGSMLKSVIQEYKPKNIVEIGTWKGLGSTMCILNAIDKNMHFISMETNLSFYEIAKKNLKNYLNDFKLLRGKIIESEDVLHFISDKNLTTEQQSWLKEDLDNMNTSENIYNQLPKVIDFLLLDGGEFSTYPEWLKLKDKTIIVALDDIRELKCNQIYRELLNDSNYSLLEETSEGNGFCIFIKK